MRLCRRLALVPFLVGGILVAAACGDVYADLEPDSVSAPNDSDASVLTPANPPSARPIVPPAPSDLGDGGSSPSPDVEASDDGGPDAGLTS